VGRIHVLDGPGKGPLSPVVLLHGMSATATEYGPLLRRLRHQARRVIALDLPGHGFSDLPWEGMTGPVLRKGLVAALDAVLDEKAWIFGNSLGGLGAIQYALARPEKVKGIVLCSPGGAPMSPEELDRLLGEFRLHSHAKAVEFIERVFAQPPRLKHLFAWGARKSFGRAPIRQLLACATTSDLLGPDELGSLSVPVLLLWGRAEKILPRSHFQFFRKHLPAHARIDEPEDFGHAPFLEQAHELTTRIVEFAKACEAAPAHEAGRVSVVA
jgi:pimeloyl-ACP methyl ester carboxylesterase